MKPDFNKGGGLLPTVVQDNTTKAVLMVAWMNEESFHIRVVLVAMCNMWWI